MNEVKFYCINENCSNIGHATSLAHIHQLGKLCDSCRSEANRESLKRKPLKKTQRVISGSYLCLSCGTPHKQAYKPYMCECKSKAFKFLKDK